jgi:hypothetical protein
MPKLTVTTVGLNDSTSRLRQASTAFSTSFCCSPAWAANNAFSSA